MISANLAAEQGGNSAFSEAGKINLVEGVKIIGVTTYTDTYMLKTYLAS